jgi:hypothetical protein
MEIYERVRIIIIYYIDCSDKNGLLKERIPRETVFGYNIY